MSIQIFTERLQSLLEYELTIQENTIAFSVNSQPIQLQINESWIKAIDSFFKARQYVFYDKRRMLTANKLVECQVVKLDPGYSFRPLFEFEDAKENKVILNEASKEFLLALFNSPEYETTFEFINKKIHRKIESKQRIRNRSNNPTSRPINLDIDDLFLRLVTAKYIPKRKPDKSKIIDISLKKIRSCLFSLSYSQNEIWELREEIKSKGFRYQNLVEEEASFDIPSASYNPNIVGYYKVAKSSTFPAQIFLSYYHILEYFFLQVADEDMFQAIKTQLNDPNFKPTYQKVTKLLAIIKRNDNTGDEKKLLRSVLDKFVPEEDFIDFIKILEQKEGNILTQKDLIVFGEKFSFRLEKGHALSNAGTLIKHIRNALVHSSDRYTREDCYIPFTESDEIVARFIPIVQYMAEQVIFSTAEC